MSGADEPTVKPDTVTVAASPSRKRPLEGKEEAEQQEGEQREQKEKEESAQGKGVQKDNNVVVGNDPVDETEQKQQDEQLQEQPVQKEGKDDTKAVKGSDKDLSDVVMVKDTIENSGTAGKEEKEGDGSGPKKLIATLPSKPIKKARTAYFIFADDKRPQIQAAVSV